MKLRLFFYSLLGVVSLMAPLAAGFNVSIEERNAKIIVHCYDQGVSKWNTLFGAVEQAIEMLRATDIDESTPIRVVGAGCMGMVMAIELKERGFEHVSITANDLRDFTAPESLLFTPGTGKETAPLDVLRVRLGISSYYTYQFIDSGLHPYLNKSIVYRIIFFTPADKLPAVGALVKLGFIAPPRSVRLDVGDGKIRENYVEYCSWFINPAELIKQLVNKVNQLNITVTVDEVEALEECDEMVVCNCAGFEGADMTNMNYEFLTNI